MRENPLELIVLVDNIEKHYLLKKNRRGRACFSSSIEAAIKASEKTIFKEELVFLLGFLKERKWKYMKEFSHWFLSVEDIKLKSMGVIV